MSAKNQTPDPRWAGYASQRGEVPSPSFSAPSSVWAAAGWVEPPVLRIANSHCQLTGVDARVHWALREELVILTESAQLQAQGWSPPEAGEGQTTWDGKIRLYDVLRQGEAGRFQTGLLSRVLGHLASWNVRVEVADDRARPEPGVPESDHSGQPLRDYQDHAASVAEKAGRGVIVAPPRAGKTRIGIEVVRRLALRTVWLAPTKNIVTQTVRAFDRHLGRNYAVSHVGSDWRSVDDKHVLVMTYDTARDLPAEFWRGREVLFVDEVHHTAADGFRALNKKIDHIYYRYGMSGTFFRSNGDDLAMHAFLSDVLFEITPSYLVGRGYLVPAHVVMVPVPEGEAVRGSNHQEVVSKGIALHDFRQQAAAWATAVMQQRGKKVVCLVSQKAQGEDLLKRIEELVPKNRPGTQFRKVEFVSTNRPSDVCQKIITAFAETEEVQVLIGTSMIGEGTDLPPADCLVYAHGGKAEVGHRQAAYRVCTATPQKRAAFIVDFTDRHHRNLFEHSVDRAMHYQDEETFTMTVLDRLDHLPAWLDHVGCR